MSKLRLLSICILVIAACFIAATLTGQQLLAQAPETPTPQPPAQAGLPVEAIVSGAVSTLMILLTSGVLWNLSQAASKARSELKECLNESYKAREEILETSRSEHEKLIEKREKLTQKHLELQKQTSEREKQALETIAETRLEQLNAKERDWEQAKDALNNALDILMGRVVNVDLRDLAPPMQSLALRRLATGALSVSEIREGEQARARLRAVVDVQDQIHDVVESRRVEMDARGRLKWGNVLFQAGEYERAIAEYERAIEMAPDDPLSYISLGTAYEKLDDFDAAIESFNTALGKEAIKDLPAYEAAALNNLGIVHYRTGKLEKAVECYSKAIELKEDYVDAYLNRSAAYEKQGHPRKAANDRKKAAELRAESDE